MKKRREEKNIAQHRSRCHESITVEADSSHIGEELQALLERGVTLGHARHLGPPAKLIAPLVARTASNAVFVVAPLAVSGSLPDGRHVERHLGGVEDAAVGRLIGELEWSASGIALTKAITNIDVGVSGGTVEGDVAGIVGLVRGVVLGLLIGVGVLIGLIDPLLDGGPVEVVEALDTTNGLLFSVLRTSTKDDG